MGVNVINKVKCYEVDGKELEIGEKREELTISSHWNMDVMVVVELNNGTSFTVLGRDLKKAIDNAMNSWDY